jgi:hypothetical protein
MIANAMFYQADSGMQKQLISIGPVKFSSTQLFTSTISTLIVLPVNLLIITIFRKYKVKSHGVLPVKVNAELNNNKKKMSPNVAKQQTWRRSSKHIETININDSNSPEVEYNNIKKNQSLKSKISSSFHFYLFFELKTEF